MSGPGQSPRLTLSLAQSVPGVPPSCQHTALCGELSSCPGEPVALVAPGTCHPQEGENHTVGLGSSVSGGRGGELFTHTGAEAARPCHHRAAYNLIQVNSPIIKIISVPELSTPRTHVFSQQLFPATQFYR